MKCYYYLSPTLAETEKVFDDLHRSGLNDWFIHIVSKDGAGLRQKRLHSSNYLQTMDLLRRGLIGAAGGFAVGLLAAGLLAYLEPFGPNLPVIGFGGVIAFFTLHGVWQGGLIGMSRENRKLRPFHAAIEAGKYLILIYAHRSEEEKVHAMMARLHPDARFVGIDPRFYNPFIAPQCFT